MVPHFFPADSSIGNFIYSCRPQYSRYQAEIWNTQSIQWYKACNVISFGVNSCEKFLFKKKSHFSHFRPNIFWLFLLNLVLTLVEVRGTLSANLTSNDLDLGKWWPFLGWEITFCHFSPNLFWLFQRNLVRMSIARGKEHLVWKFDLAWPRPHQMVAIFRVEIVFLHVCTHVCMHVCLY